MPAPCWSRRPSRACWPCRLLRSHRWPPGHRWAAAKTPGPLHAFFLRIRARRGHQVAAVATARKLAVLVWHLLTREQDYLWARPALVAHKLSALGLEAGRPEQKGNRRGVAYAYNVKALRTQEMAIAEQAERAYEHAVEHWQDRPRRQAASADYHSVGERPPFADPG